MLFLQKYAVQWWNRGVDTWCKYVHNAHVRANNNFHIFVPSNLQLRLLDVKIAPSVTHVKENFHIS